MGRVRGATTTQYCCSSHPGSSVDGLGALCLYSTPFALLAHPQERKLEEGESSSSKLECESVSRMLLKSARRGFGCLAASGLETDRLGWLTDKMAATESFGLAALLLTAVPWSMAADVC